MYLCHSWAYALNNQYLRGFHNHRKDIIYFHETAYSVIKFEIIERKSPHLQLSLSGLCLHMLSIETDHNSCKFYIIAGWKE